MSGSRSRSACGFRSFALFVSLLAPAFVLVLALPAADARAGFPKLPKLKEKVAEAKDAAKSVLPDNSKGEEEQPAAEPKEGQPAAGQAAPPPAASGAAEDMALYTKYDFIPGDKVIFYDDLAREEMGEFPSRWNLDRGVFEIARAEGRNWILCTDHGRILPKITPGPLPDKYTVELDVYSAMDQDGWYHLHWIDANGESIGRINLGYSYMTEVILDGKQVARKEVPKLPKGRHVVRIMATTSTIKCYVDQERIANVPKVEGFAPAGFAVEINPYFEGTQACRIGSFRYAEGGKTMREQLDESGRIVTHGILFDSGSAVIKAESYKTLALIGEMLGGDAALRLSIEGHTDSDGADDANLKLSQQRAEAVKAYLASGFKVGADRLEAKGLGETKPIDANTTPEGKANNRRVELVKL